MTTIRALFLATLMTLSYSVFGQRIDTVKLLLTNRHFGQLDNYLSSVNASANGVSYNQELIRQIVADFSEIQIYFEESLPSKEENVFTVYQYRSFLITKGDTIIYCKTISRPNSYKPKTEVSFADNIAFKELQNQYLIAYDKTVIINDFFTTKDVVYGDACGFAGNVPEYRIKLDKLVATKNIKELNNWLRSPVTELQIYAIDGLHQLKRFGYKPTATELAIIKLIKAKQGTVRTCSGCTYWTQTIKDVTKGFKF